MLETNQTGFQKKFIFLKIVENSKFAVDCQWMSKISQKIETLAPSWKKDWFFEEKSSVF